jgi:hypothetical protein
MAYDPNDPETKAAVQAAVDEALEAAREEHQGEVDRLKEKNTEILGKLKKAREGKEDAGEVARLEGELETTQGELREAQSKLRVTERDLKRANDERDTATRERDTAVTERNNELLTNSLNAALIENKVAPHFMDAANALLKGKATVEVEGDVRKVLIDGKDVGEFVKDWAASDAGKHYVTAPANGGGGATGPNGNGNPNGGKALKDMTEAERTEMARTRPQEFQALVAAEQGNNAIPVIN